MFAWRISIIAIAIVICVMTCLFNTTVANATTAKEVKERWYDTRYYPLYQGNEEWQKHDMLDTLDILNPPPDLLLSMSTEELAELMQEYPLLWQVTTYETPDGKWNFVALFLFLETNCDIFYELLSREDGITCLLQEYRTNDVDLEMIKNREYSDDNEQKCLEEQIGCQFIRHYAHHFTENEYTLASEIIEEKKEQYAVFDDVALFYLDLPEIEPPTGEKVSDIRTNYLYPEAIQEKEDKFAAALLQMQEKENNVQAEKADPEDSTTEKMDEGNESTIADPVEKKRSPEPTIAVGVILGVVCVVGGCVFICRRRKPNP